MPARSLRCGRLISTSRRCKSPEDGIGRAVGERRRRNRRVVASSCCFQVGYCVVVIASFFERAAHVPPRVGFRRRQNLQFRRRAGWRAPREYGVDRHQPCSAADASLFDVEIDRTCCGRIRHALQRRRNVDSSGGGSIDNCARIERLRMAFHAQSRRWARVQSASDAKNNALMRRFASDAGSGGTTGGGRRRGPAVSSLPTWSSAARQRRRRRRKMPAGCWRVIDRNGPYRFH